MRAHDRSGLVSEAAQEAGAAIASRVTLDGVRVAGPLDAKAGSDETATIDDAGHEVTLPACANTDGSVMLMIEPAGVRACDSTPAAKRPGTTDTPRMRISLEDRTYEERRFGTATRAPRHRSLRRQRGALSAFDLDRSGLHVHSGDLNDDID
jgi:hypothetical protein